MPSNHLILCRSLLLLPSIFPSIRDFSNESALRIRWPKYWSFSFSISPSNEHPGLISFRMGWLDFLVAIWKARSSLLSLIVLGESQLLPFWLSLDIFPGSAEGDGTRAQPTGTRQVSRSPSPWTHPAHASSLQLWVVMTGVKCGPVCQGNSSETLCQGSVLRAGEHPLPLAVF